ncbi:hypothetical protein SLEP1_g54899 [Rubroshorea leprosula]|uniref:DUF4220 domain-containing protein n=1 Tax=Rubroshorea leprosula TaxID=152421 RepID=A0AAV5MEK3_9ROSI|nr:hypothetical protein SLEP1_g54899 [Rubroshorea leprosula]
MVLFSLTLQIVLYILGSRRKYTIKPFFKIILWFAYLGADWIAIATLGKLSISNTETPTTNVLRAYWAPLLLLHLGGPDTITAYAFEDNKLWIRHLLILIVKAIFVVYVVCLSWTFSWLSFLSFPLILAGIINFVSSFLVLLLFFISIINEPKFQFSRVDLAITGILLTGAIALELYAAWLMLSSDWAILVAAFHHNMLVRKMFWAASKSFRWLLHRRKRWSNHIGQFDLLKYCWLYKKKQVNQSYTRGILRKITNGNDFIEMLHKCMFTKFVPVPSYLEDIGNFMKPITSFLVSESFWPSRGKIALKDNEQYDNLRWSIELDFDYSIIIWHLATSVCYLQEDHDDDQASVCSREEDHDKNEAMETSKLVSDYMMYLLAMCPAMILPDHSKNFWLDHAYDELKELLFSATDDITNAASTLLSNRDNVRDEEELESSESAVENLQGDGIKSSEMTFKNLQRDVSKLVTSLKKSKNKWRMIRDVWIEIIVYAAISSQHISHVKQLGEGIEFLSIVWLFVGLNFIFHTLATIV